MQSGGSPEKRVSQYNSSLDDWLANSAQVLDEDLEMQEARVAEHRAVIEDEVGERLGKLISGKEIVEFFEHDWVEHEG